MPCLNEESLSFEPIVLQRVPPEAPPAAYDRYAGQVRERLRLGCPWASPESREDALQEAALWLVENGDSVREGTSEADLCRLLYTVAWRRVRGQDRRGRRERSWNAEKFDIGGMSYRDLEQGAVLRGDLEWALVRASLVVPMESRAAAREGLLTSAWNGESDVVVASRLGVRREYIARMRRALRELLCA